MIKKKFSLIVIALVLAMALSFSAERATYAQENSAYTSSQITLSDIITIIIENLPGGDSDGDTGGDVGGTTEDSGHQPGPDLCGGPYGQEACM